MADKKIVTLDQLKTYDTKVKEKLNEKLGKNGEQILNGSLTLVGSTIIGGIDINNYDATLPENQVTPDSWLDLDSTVIEGNQNLSVGARNYTRGNYNIASGLFNTIFSTEPQKNDDGTEKLDENGNPMPALVNRSLAVGYMNQVRKSDSAAIGDRNVVTGGNSVALAYQNEITSDGGVAGGEYNKVSGESSIALGYKNNVSGTASFAANGLNTIIGSYSAAFGENNTVNSYATFAAGKNNIVSGEASFALGKSNTTNGDTIFATGKDNNISGNYSSVFGKDNTVSSNCATAFGASNTVGGVGSFAANGNNTTTEGYATAFGDHNTVGGYAGFASGQNNTITRQRGFVANNKNTVSGEDAAAFGTNNTAKGLSSFVGGRGNIAGVQMSFVMGNSNEVYAGKDSWGYDTGSGAVVFGNHNKSAVDWQLVTGRWNKEDSSALFIIGNGYDESSRANAFVAYSNGRVEISRNTVDTDSDKTLVTKGYVSPVKNDVTILKSDVTILKSDVTTLKTLIDGLSNAQIAALNSFAKSLVVEEA